MEILFGAAVLVGLGALFMKKGRKIPAVLVLLVGLGGFALNFAVPYFVVSCDNMARRLVDEFGSGTGDPAARRLIHVTKTKKVHEDPDVRLDCEGEAVWSTGERTPLDFFAYKEDQRWFMTYREP